MLLNNNSVVTKRQTVLCYRFVTTALRHFSFVVTKKNMRKREKHRSRDANKNWQACVDGNNRVRLYHFCSAIRNGLVVTKRHNVLYYRFVTTWIPRLIWRACWYRQLLTYTWKPQTVVAHWLTVLWLTITGEGQLNQSMTSVTADFHFVSDIYVCNIRDKNSSSAGYCVLQSNRLTDKQNFK